MISCKMQLELMQRMLILNEETMKLFKRNKFFPQDRIAMRIAARHGMTYEYKLARRKRLDPIEALEDWDLMTPEDYALFNIK